MLVRAGLVSVLLLVVACTPRTKFPKSTIPAKMTLNAAEIIRAAHAHAGGPEWVSPKTLSMKGYAVFYPAGQYQMNDRHEMWRVYPQTKADAHTADGKVRIDSVRGGEMIFQIAFDGSVTYDKNGPLEGDEGTDRWRASFGFGVIRFALDDGYKLRREADDLVDGRPVYTTIVTDPQGGETLFGIAHDNFAILKVGFDTPRGWHERIYSDFFSNPGVNWKQPGRVRLFYNGIKSNEVIWTSFELNQKLADDLFVLPQAE